MKSLELLIRTLTLILLLVVLYILAVLLYSVKYWPDVYNYINAKITIKHIPTLSELNESNVEKDFNFFTTDEPIESVVDGTTESVFSDIFSDSFTTTSDDDLAFPQLLNERSLKIKYVNDEEYSTIPKKPVIVDYFFDYRDENEKDLRSMKDLIDTRKLMRRRSKDVQVFAKRPVVKVIKPTKNKTEPDLLPVFPWIVAIYIKPAGGDQFEYYCDGVILSDRCILTAARCIWRGNQTVNTNALIAILGKQNLKIMRYEERVIKISQITMHPNFTVTGEEAINDLAMLHMEDAVIFSDTIAPARLETEEENGEIDKAATTGWSFSGQLTPIYFEQQISEYCRSKTKGAHFCATYGQDVTVCPSFGGVFVIKMSSRWYLHGINNGAPTHRGACFGKDAVFTSLTTYAKWIQDTLQAKYI